MSTLSEINDAVETVRFTGNKQLALLHCNSSYPSTHAEINLKFMENLDHFIKFQLDFLITQLIYWRQKLQYVWSKYNREAFYFK